MYKWRQVMVKKPLSNLGEGESGEIVQIRGKPEMHRHYYGMGLAVGRSIAIKKVKSTPDDYAVTIETGGRLETLDRNAALSIQVKVPVNLDEREIPDLSRAYSRLNHVTDVFR